MIWNVSPKKRSSSSPGPAQGGLPLDRQRRRYEDQHPLHRLAQLHLLDIQPSHDRLARAGIIGQQEAETRLRQHPLVDSLDLMGERADAGEGDGELPVMGVGQADAGRFD